MPRRAVGKEITEPAAHQLEVGQRRCLCLGHGPGILTSDLDARASVTV